MTEEQFTRAAEKYMDTVYRIAVSYLKSPDAADDITQETFLRLFRADTVFESEAHLKNWLIRVCINECKRSFFSARYKTEALEDYADKLSFSTAENSGVFQAVMTLPRKYRLVIHLHYYEGYTTPEIARFLKIPPSTVRTQLERGRRLLKQTLLEADNV